MPKESDFTFVFIAWCSSILLYALAIAFPKSLPRLNFQGWWNSNRWIISILGIILVAALAVRVWNLSTIPFNLHGDEGQIGLESVKVLNGELKHPFITTWGGQPTIGFYFNSISIYLFGQNKFGLRFPWVLVGTASVLCAFFLATRLRDSTYGLIVAALLALYHYHIHYSRLGASIIADTLFVSLILLFLQRALDENRRIDWVLTGFIGGFSLYFYIGARFTSIVVFSVLGYRLLYDGRKFLKENYGGIIFAAFAFLITAAPMIQFAIQHPEPFMSRMNEVGLIQTGWLEQEMVKQGTGALPILWEQFYRAALAFNYYPDKSMWYHLPEPLLDPVFGGLFALGLIFATIRSIGPRADRRLFPIVFWWFGAIILGGMLTVHPPTSQRLVTTSVPACFFIGLTIWTLTRPLEKRIGTLLTKSLIALVVLIFGIGSLKLYFVDFSPKRLYAGHARHPEISTEIAPILNQLGETHRTYFFGPPRFYFKFGTIRYLAPKAEGEDIIEPLKEPPGPDFIDRTKGAVFVFLPHRLNEMEFVQQTFPNGIVEEIISPADGAKIVTLYTVPPEG